MKMKQLGLTLAFCVCILLPAGLHAQAKVESEAAVVKFALAEENPLKVGGTTQLLVEATPKRGWHVYSANPSDDGAYQPAILGWEVSSRGFEATPKLDEKGAMTSQFDEIMNGVVRYYKGAVTFSQEVKLTEEEVALVGYFDYMACNEEKCIPLTAEFKLEAKAKK